MWASCIIALCLLVLTSVQAFAEEGNVKTVVSYMTENECQKETKATCQYVMCDYIPSDKTFEEVCGVGFQKGWQPVMPTDNSDQIEDVETNAN